MPYSFSQFTDTSKRHENRITVTKSRSIGFPTYFYNENNIESYQYAVLFFDQASNAVGIRFINDESQKGKFKIAKNKQGHGATIAAQSYFKGNRIDVERYYGRYEYKRVSAAELGLGEGEIFIIDLKDNGKEAS
jgi:hypothetical protein